MPQPEAFSVWRASHDLHSRRAAIDHAVAPPATSTTTTAPAPRPTPAPAPNSSRKQQMQSFGPGEPGSRTNTFGTPTTPQPVSPEEEERRRAQMRSFLNEIAPLRTRAAQ